MRALPSYEYELTAPIPEIDGEVGDVLVWQWPRVGLVKFLPGDTRIRDMALMPAHWQYLFFKYEDRLQPCFRDLPSPIALARAVRTGSAPGGRVSLARSRLRLMD